MQGVSVKSLREVLEKTAAVISNGSSGSQGGVDPHKLGTDLFSLALTLDGAHSLRRALTEPAVPTEAKARLLHTLFDGKVADATLEIAEAGVGRRWSRTRDFADALEEASVAALAALAEDAGELDEVEDNLFRFARLLEANAGLREALADRAVPLQGKRSLLKNLVGNKVDDTTLTMLGQAAAGRHRNMGAALGLYQRIAAAQRDRMIATVWVASPLSDEHRSRLAEALSQQHDRKIHLNVVVDPDVLGGVRVSVGDEVLDSTVDARLKQAQRRLER
jgi:F-type H+-transporting ATPase subunit delta